MNSKVPLAMQAERPQLLLASSALRTPCFVYDESKLHELLRRAKAIEDAANVNVLYALKPFSFIDVLQLMSTSMKGFAASSMFEARLAAEIVGDGGSVHFTSPGIRPKEFPEIAGYCDYVSFNSLSQWDRHSDEAREDVSCGLRINPQLSLVDDPRYDPCRPHSKLGVPIDQAARAISQTPGRFDRLSGIHFHTNCDSADFGGLLTTANAIEDQLGSILESLDWVNLGGGYLFDDESSYSRLAAASAVFTDGYGLEAFVEPGAAIVREAASIVSSVVDMFSSGGEVVAVLDATVNHMPEVFEYEFEPDVIGHDDDAEHKYILAGSSCLAGDVFGRYSFREPLATGDRVIFENAGAYTLPKAHMFNGIDLPAIYALTIDGELLLKREFGYPAFVDRWKAKPHAVV